MHVILTIYNPITTNEVEKAIAHLNNNRACGEDGIPGELIKYGADTLAKVICNILTRVFSEHDDTNINGGKVITLQKQGKALALSLIFAPSLC
ncbi:very-long-chain enoyl-CoA reductase [Elysia marginata]|uniref:Very-long-chain enoyl-CoA reductase n=1 Tax=Elysia marginata TaxID=1093978 RepID=A0AAV4ILK9_9GAST|nr:very-long-chain enoyl-CoA reductase [Elysia marginata]